MTSPSDDHCPPPPTVSDLSRSEEDCECLERARRRRRRSNDNDDAMTPIRSKNIATCHGRIRLWRATILLLVGLFQCEAFLCFRSLRLSSSPPAAMLCSSSFGESIRHGCRRHRSQRHFLMSDRNGNHSHNGHQHDERHHGNNVPRHVAFICDGNSRWAQARGAPASVGHLAGADRLIDCLHTLKRACGIEYCTFYGFSTENWKRSPEEIRDILFVMEQTARKFYTKAIDEQVRVKILGDLDDSRIPQSLCHVLQKLERDTAGFPSTSLTVCIAINYGGRQDIVNASVRMAQAIASGDLHADEVTEDDFSSLLYTSDIPDPDLMIRTGGEKRLSNFLLWNCAYSELYFCNDLWPDFDDSSMLEALEWYSSRSRRFGGRKNAEKVTVSSSSGIP